MGRFDDNIYLGTLTEAQRNQLKHHQYYFDTPTTMNSKTGLPRDITYLHIDYQNGVMVWTDEKTQSNHISYVLPPQDRPGSNKDLTNSDRHILYTEAMDNLKKGLKTYTLQELSFMQQYKYMQKHEYLRDDYRYHYIESEMKNWSSRKALKTDATVRQLMKDKKDYNTINAIVQMAPPDATNSDLLRYVERYYILKNKNQVVQQMPDGKYIIDYKYNGMYTNKFYRTY